MESAPNMCNIPLEADNIDDSFIETSFEKSCFKHCRIYVKTCVKKDSWKIST